MDRHLKISQHKHSGHLLPHEETSYLPLFILTLITGFILLAVTLPNSVLGSPPPQAESVSLTGEKAEAPPKTGAVITSPTNGQHFTNTPITVSGTCPANTLVEIYKNNIFAGSVPCTSNGTFTLQIDLLYGQNNLIAQVYDDLNQEGPPSPTVTVYYDVTLPQSVPSGLLNFTGTELLLNTDAAFRGTFPGQTMYVPLSIIGGTPPFAVNVEWGDLNNKVISRNNNATFDTSHVYQKAGTYEIEFQATDSKGLVAYLNVAAIVNGQPAISSTNSTSSKPPNKLLMLWPVIAILITLVVSFWLGERREKRVMEAKARIPTNPFGSAPPAPKPTS